MKIKIPNILTIGRIIIVPIFVLSFFIPGIVGDLVPFFLFILASFTDLFGYTLMLAAMTYTLTYFFAVVIGSGVGRFVSERLMEKFRIKRTPPRNCC